METLEQIPKTTVDIIHHFYCDNCNKHIGSSKEHDDGYYEEFGAFDLDFLLPDGRYYLSACLCEVCQHKYMETIQGMLQSLGFVKGEY